MKNGLKIYLNEVFKKIQTMPFDPNSTNKVGEKSKREFTKKEESLVKEKLDLIYKKALGDLLKDQDKFTKIELVKVFVTLSNYLFSKTKFTREKFTQEKIKQIKKFLYNKGFDFNKIIFN